MEELLHGYNSGWTTDIEQCKSQGDTSAGDGRRNLIFLDKCPSYTLKRVSMLIWNTLKSYTLPPQKMSDCVL